MKIGMCAWVVPGDDVEAMGIAKELGVSAIVINYGEALLEEGNREILLKASKKTGIAIPTLAINDFCHLAITKSENRDKAKKVIKNAIDIAMAMDIKALQIPHFYESLIVTDEDLLNTIEVLRYACELGSDSGIVIGTENVMTINQMNTCIESLNSECFKVLFDTQNPWRMLNQDGPAIAAGLMDHIYEVHAKDSIINDKGEKCFVPLGSGDVKFDESMKLIKESGFDRWVILESPYNKDSYAKEITEDITYINNL